MTIIQNFYGLYTALQKDVNDNLLQIFEYLEVVQPTVTEWVNNDFLDMARYISDDTTSGRAFELKKSSIKLEKLLSEILSTYIGISDKEQEKLLKYTGSICENLAVIHYSTEHYSEYMESIRNNTFSLENIEMTPYVARIAAQGEAVLINDIKIVIEILSTFDIFLPEYVLDDDDLDLILNYMEDNGLDSHEIGTIDRRLVRRQLYEG